MKRIMLDLTPDTIETEKAFGFRMYDKETDSDITWVAKSQMKDVERDSDGTIGFYLPDWLVKKKGLESYIDDEYEQFTPNPEDDWLDSVF